MSDLTLDHLEPIRLPDAERRSYHNQLRYLDDCRSGLALLARNVNDIETVIASRCAPPDKVRSVEFGSTPLFDGIPMGVVNCMFQWFAVSASNYARVVGGMRWDMQGIGEKGSDYAARVLGPVQTFRDKIGAHPVGATKNQKDNVADRQHSFFPQVAWEDGRLVAGSFILTMGGAGGYAQSSPLGWSLTKAFEEMARRYWPAQPEAASTT